jgi:hypothetical protein
MSTVRWTYAVSAFLIGICLGACAASKSPSATDVEDLLLGTWKVDLRPTPDAEPYYKILVVTSVQAKSFSGSFYDAPISQGRINRDWGKLRIAFVTVDGSGPYHHSAILDGNKLEGLSNSTGRNFLAYWSAIKQ